jgi:hypothetical protein
MIMLIKVKIFIFKQQPDPLCLSTIESMYTVINLLKKANIEQCDTKDFLLPFEKLIEHQLDFILNPNSANYRPTAIKELTPKDRYKVNPERSVIFEGG